MAIRYKSSSDQPTAASRLIAFARDIQDNITEYAASQANAKTDDAFLKAVAEDAKREKVSKKLTKVAHQIEAAEIPSGGKTRTTIYLSDEVIAFFKATGPGWQTRLNDVLLRLVREGASQWLSL